MKLLAEFENRAEANDYVQRLVYRDLCVKGINDWNVVRKNIRKGEHGYNVEEDIEFDDVDGSIEKCKWVVYKK